MNMISAMVEHNIMYHNMVAALCCDCCLFYDSTDEPSSTIICETARVKKIFTSKIEKRINTSAFKQTKN